jgi:hypothetical protein
VPIPSFDAFIAIDWSGAARAYNGIAAAICRKGRTPPEVVPPPGRRWTRGEIAEWLKRRLEERKRLLIGFDFAFGFPYEDCGYLGGQADGVDNIFALWELIEAKSGGDADFGCSRFLADPIYSPLFWTAGPKPQEWVERKRQTEHACAELTKTRPDTLYKLLHSKQVGKASITGMRVLRYVRSCRKDCVAIWPFETLRTSAVVEIYPTMFRKRATGSVAKLRSMADLNLALDVLHSDPIPKIRGTRLSDHETDALISAAGMRWIASKPEVWTSPEVRSARVRREGWIFGICNGCCENTKG